VYAGDFFAFGSKFESSPFDAVWDRAALVAINVSDRSRYVSIMKSVMGPSCRYLLATVDYDTSEYIGPPHALTEEDLRQLFTRNTSESESQSSTGSESTTESESTSESQSTTESECTSDSVLSATTDSSLQIMFVEKVDALVERRKQVGLTRFDESIHVVSWKP